MKTQTLNITIAMVLAVLSSLYGQNPDKQSNRFTREQLITAPETEHTVAATSGGFYLRNTLTGEAATAYLTPDFLTGEIVMANGAAIEDLPMRYNLYTQQMQYIDDADTLAIGNPQEIEYLMLGEKTFVHAEYLCSGEIKQGYFELLEDGECRLLKRWYAMYQIKDPSPQSTDECGVFYRNCRCFLQFGDNPAVVVSQKRKTFAGSFGNQTESIKKMMRTEKLKTNREDDLRKIVAFYNLLF